MQLEERQQVNMATQPSKYRRPSNLSIGQQEDSAFNRRAVAMPSPQSSSGGGLRISPAPSNAQQWVGFGREVLNLVGPGGKLNEKWANDSRKKGEKAAILGESAPDEPSGISSVLGIDKQLEGYQTVKARQALVVFQTKLQEHTKNNLKTVTEQNPDDPMDLGVSLEEHLQGAQDIISQMRQAAVGKEGNDAWDEAFFSTAEKLLNENMMVYSTAVQEGLTKRVTTALDNEINVSVRNALSSIGALSLIDSGSPSDRIKARNLLQRPEVRDGLAKALRDDLTEKQNSYSKNPVSSMNRSDISKMYANRVASYADSLGIDLFGFMDLKDSSGVSLMLADAGLATAVTDMRAKIGDRIVAANAKDAKAVAEDHLLRVQKASIGITNMRNDLLAKIGDARNATPEEKAKLAEEISQQSEQSQEAFRLLIEEAVANTQDPETLSNISVLNRKVSEELLALDQYEGDVKEQKKALDGIRSVIDSESALSDLSVELVDIEKLPVKERKQKINEITKKLEDMRRTEYAGLGLPTLDATAAKEGLARAKRTDELLKQALAEGNALGDPTVEQEFAVRRANGTLTEDWFEENVWGLSADSKSKAVRSIQMIDANKSQQYNQFQKGMPAKVSAISKFARGKVIGDQWYELPDNGFNLQLPGAEPEEDLGIAFERAYRLLLADRFQELSPDGAPLPVRVLRDLEIEAAISVGMTEEEYKMAISVKPPVTNEVDANGRPTGRYLDSLRSLYDKAQGDSQAFGIFESQALKFMGVDQFSNPEVKREAVRAFRDMIIPAPPQVDTQAQPEAKPVDKTAGPLANIPIPGDTTSPIVKAAKATKGFVVDNAKSAVSSLAESLGNVAEKINQEQPVEYGDVYGLDSRVIQVARNSAGALRKSRKDDYRYNVEKGSNITYKHATEVPLDDPSVSYIWEDIRNIEGAIGDISKGSSAYISVMGSIDRQIKKFGANENSLILYKRVLNEYVKNKGE